MRACLPSLLGALFLIVQTAALTHELQHVLHQHQEPCGLHVAADQLAMATAPEPARAVDLEPAVEPVPVSPDTSPTRPPLPSGARAPPVLG